MMPRPSSSRPDLLNLVPHVMAAVGVRRPTRYAPWATAFWVFLVLGPLLLGACSRTPDPEPEDVPESIVLENTPGGSCGIDIPAPGSNESGEESADQTQIRALIAAEGRFVVNREIGPLMALWAEDSQVINAKNTPADEEDNQIWQGTDAIRHRYLNVVFPSAPETVGNLTLQVSVDGDRAQAQGTTQIGGEVSPNGDLWQLQRSDGCWYLQALTYNLEPLASPLETPGATQNAAP